MTTKPLSLLISVWIAAPALAADLPAPATTTNANSAGPAANRASPPSAAALREKTEPAVVSLYSVGRRAQQATSQGTGFLISEDGILVTARHVSEANDELFAFTADGKKYPVTGFFGEDRDYDVAVLKIEGRAFPHLSVAKTPLRQTNQWVAVVSPETKGGTLCSTGTVKELPAPVLFGTWGAIRTTIPMHPGQSGSPLFNESGEVVGVVCWIDAGQNGSVVPAGIVQQILAKAQSAGPVAFAKRPRKGSSEPVMLDKDFRASVQAIEQKNWKEGQRLLKRVAKKFPESPLALLFLGASSIQLQSWSQADAALAKAVRLRPDSGMGWYMYGMTAASRGRYAESEAAFKKSIELHFPDKDQLTSAWYMIALTNAGRKNVNGVKEALNNLRHLDPAKAKECAREIRRNFPKLELPGENE